MPRTTPEAPSKKHTDKEPTAESYLLLILLIILILSALNSCTIQASNPGADQEQTIAAVVETLVSDSRLADQGELKAKLAEYVWYSDNDFEIRVTADRDIGPLELTITTTTIFGSGGRTSATTTRFFSLTGSESTDLHEGAERTKASISTGNGSEAEITVTGVASVDQTEETGNTTYSWQLTRVSPLADGSTIAGTYSRLPSP